MMKILIRLLLFVSCFLPSLAWSQDQVELQFISFPKALDPQEMELYLGDGETLQVELPTNRVSRSYSVKAADQWILGKTMENDAKEPHFKAFAKAKSIGLKKQLILVIRKSRHEQNQIALIPMPNTERDFGGGEYFFMNATPLEIAGILSDKKFALKPGKFTVVKPSPSEVKGIYQYCKAELLYRKEDQVRSFFNTTWRLNEKARSLIILYQDPATQKIRLHTIRDYL